MALSISVNPSKVYIMRFTLPDSFAEDVMGFVNISVLRVSVYKYFSVYIKTYVEDSLRDEQFVCSAQFC